MDMLLGAILAIVGVLALIRGRLSFSKESVSVGPPARIAGAILLAALPLAILVNMVITVMERSGRSPVPENYAGVVTYVVFIVCAIVAFIVAKKGVP